MEAILHIFGKIWDKPLSALHENYVLFGGFIGLFGLVSLFVKEKLYLTESLVATLVGIVFGPCGFRLVVPKTWFATNFHEGLRETARLVIGLQVMAAGVSTPGDFLRKNKLAIGMMLGPVMAVMWAISALCIQLTLRLGWFESLIVAACVTPTDPVLAHSVIKGKFAERYIPTRLRHLLAVESGANDGLGFPFMMLPMWLLLKDRPASALSHWLLHTWVWEIFVSIIVGYLCGVTARYLLKFSMSRKLIDKESFLVFTIALTLFVSGVVALMASDDLFAIFIAGNVFAWEDRFVSATEDSHISGVIDMLFNITFFVFFGALIPWAEFVEIGVWRLLGAATLILLFRRLPVVMLMRTWIPTLQSRKEAFFAGWFGPMGVGAIFFAIQARDFINGASESSEAHLRFAEKVFPLVAFIVLCSILIHGITVPLTNSHLKRRMRRKVKRRKKQAALEAANSPATSHPHHPSSETLDATSPAAEDPAGLEEEYIYVTDDEDNGEVFDYESTIQEGITPLSDVVVDPSSPQSTVHRTRRVKRVLVRPTSVEELASGQQVTPTPTAHEGSLE